MSQFIEMFGDPIKNSHNWDIDSLSALGELKNGMNFSINESGCKIKCLGVSDFKERNNINSTEVSSILSLNSYPSEDYILKDNDIVFVRSNGNKDLVGRCMIIVSNNEPLTFSGFCIRLRLNSLNVMPEFLVFLFKHPSIRQQIAGRGANINNLNQKSISALQIIQPPMEFQQQFVTIVHQADKSEFDEFKSQFIEMFGDPSIDIKWQTKKLKVLGSLDRGVSKARPRNTPELLGGPYPLIQTGNITEAKLYIKDYHQTYSELGLAQSKMWKRGTLCITIAANIAQTAILDIDACFPDSVVGFIPYNVETIFIHYWFSFIQQVLEQQAPQTAQKNINLKILRELDVIVPPKELQSQFVNIVLQADKSESDILYGITSLTKNIKTIYNGIL